MIATIKAAATYGLPVATIMWSGVGLLGSVAADPQVSGIGFLGAGVVQMVILKKLFAVEKRLSWIEGHEDIRPWKGGDDDDDDDDDEPKRPRRKPGRRQEA